MKDAFVADEWQTLCERLMSSARNHGSTIFIEQASEFCAQEPPRRYPEFLSLLRSASELAQSWDTEFDVQREHQEAAIDEALDESFPASDPPAWP